MNVEKSSVLALAMLVAAPAFADVAINIDPAKPGAVVNKNLHGRGIPLARQDRPTQAMNSSILPKCRAPTPV
jgi:hypothetical protein